MDQIIVQRKDKCCKTLIERIHIKTSQRAEDEIETEEKPQNMEVKRNNPNELYCYLKFIIRRNRKGNN
jgi:hypothetical protein